jgi:hypothetical protein
MVGFKGCSRESTCQAAIKTLRAAADLAALVLPVRCLTSTYRRCQGLDSRPAC